ncbi:DarT ssDNA thymidine ADP-ribosyltransferase family protein [Oscillatoria acuminata]|nr:DarT ssDNA thymidine ADP-ribosyltransferase family protein [Oscillatoria acuminata]
MTTYIYHITHLRNLPSILHSGGILANNRLKSQRINYVDIAHETIQNKRA